MISNSDLERTMGHAEKTLSQLRNNRIRANPRNFELWYTYVSGFDQTLNRAMDDAMSHYDQVPESVVQDIYEQFLSPTRMGDPVEAVSGEFLKAFNSISTAIDEVKSSTVGYQQLLKDTAAKLDAAGQGEDVQMIVKELLAATQDVEKRVQSLDSKLSASKQHIHVLHENLESVRVATITDSLTGIGNRAHFDRRLKQLMRESEIVGGSFALLIGDIDHFKRFNDNFGHQTGDQVLRLVAHALKSNVKGRDLAARYGGDEFAVILTEAGLNDAITVGNQFRNSIMAKELMKKSTGESLGIITMSFGAATYRRGESIEALIARADMCLYAAKKVGRNRVHSESEAMPELVSDVA